MENDKKQKVNLLCIIGAIIMFFIAIILNCITNVLQFRVSENYVKELIPKHALVGIGFGLAVAIITFLFTIILAKNKKNKLLLVLTIIYFIISIGVGAISVKSVVKEIKQERETCKKITEIVQSSLNNEDISSLEFDKNTYGYGVSVLELTQKYYMDGYGKSVALQKEIDLIGFKTILLPESLSNNEKLIESKNKIKKTADLLNKYKRDTDVTLENFKKDANSDKISKIYRKGFVKGVLESFPEDKEYLDKCFNSADLILKDTQKILEFIETRHGNFKATENMIYFYSDSEVDEYNNYRQTLNKDIEEAEKIEGEFKDSLIKRENKLSSFMEN
ncbi:hypothetical protein SAMN02745163_01024 [Clostridium cavendishii DSM 21758]|uniref:Uncharacterized protein n=1 Tax=Clostridium cavendishii DSM 21758 TaxID=1121302 RepID=A0A1M6F382_9CLOT|nr:hypothetical protein [Clostridium cavendishii]SHI92133.1 hypothetical protein SAMN02745163_01024 [Clostridium cavendishii DSM 21758]